MRYLKKTINKKTFTQYFIADDQPIHETINIANMFNNYYTELGPKLEAQINFPANKTFLDYLVNRTVNLNLRQWIWTT